MYVHVMRHIEMEGGNPLNVIIDVRAMDREHTKKKKFMIARVGRVGDLSENGKPFDWMG